MILPESVSKSVFADGTLANCTESNCSLAIDPSSAMRGKVVLDFYADWCEPCQQMLPLFEKLKREMGVQGTGSIRFIKVDVDHNQLAADEFGVRSIPTLLFLDDGEEMDRVMGTMREETFRQRLSRAFKR